MKYLLFTFIVLGFCESLFGADSQKEIEELTSRLTAKYLNESVDENAVGQYIREMQPDGSFPGIDYTIVTNNFPAGPHLEHLKEMAIAYCKVGNEYYGSKILYDKLLFGLGYWMKMQPVSKNWWFNDIGAPQDYMVPLLLLKSKIPREQLLYLSSYLKDKTGNKAHKAKNRTWVSDITIHKGCIEDNYELVRIGFESIASTIQIVPRQGDEGIKIDGSLHQHRPQLYSGGYGMSFVDDLADFILLAEGTSFASLFTPEKKTILTSLLLDGHRLLGYRNTFEHGANGRNITRENGVSNISAKTLVKMIRIDPEHANDYRAWIKHLRGGRFPVPGNKYFWKSDIMTQHGEKYYLSAKVVSTRTNGTEMINGENLKGYNLPLGATQILVSGKEYKNIYPLWNWCMIPGTTAIQQPDSALLGGYLFGINEFGGGVSNGRNGLIAYEHSYRGVGAKKAYFFIDDVMVCLGAGIISTAPEEAFTTVNQCFFSGKSVVYKEQTMREYQSGMNVCKPEWVYHDRIGYLFLDNTKGIACCSRIQKGAWRDLRINGSSRPLSGELFNLWIDHGKRVADGYYAYLVAPDLSLKGFRSLISEQNYRVVRNAEDIQAVEYKRGQSFAAVFYSPGSIKINDEITLTSRHKIVLYCDRKKDGFRLWVADPLYSQKVVQLTLNDREINVILPTGDYLGSSVYVDLKEPSD